MSFGTRTIRFAVTVFFCAFIFLMFFNGYKTTGPARGKFKKLGESAEDLIKPEAPPEEDWLKSVAGDKRVRNWEEWWGKCVPGFSVSGMESVSQEPIIGEDVEFIPKGKMNEGPGSALYVASPGGKNVLNPYFGRLVFKKEADGWQPYIEFRCGAALYNVKEKRARKIIDCSALDGIDDAFWQSTGRMVLTGYTAISKEMNVDCEDDKACAMPTIWIVDLKTNLIGEWRGGLAKHGQCEPGGYLKKKFPKFFGEE